MRPLWASVRTAAWADPAFLPVTGPRCLVPHSSSMRIDGTV